MHGTSQAGASMLVNEPDLLPRRPVPSLLFPGSTEFLGRVETIDSTLGSG